MRFSLYNIFSCVVKFSLVSSKDLIARLLFFNWTGFYRFFIFLVASYLLQLRQPSLFMHFLLPLRHSCFSPAPRATVVPPFVLRLVPSISRKKFGMQRPICIEESVGYGWKGGAKRGYSDPVEETKERGKQKPILSWNGRECAHSPSCSSCVLE